MARSATGKAAVVKAIDPAMVVSHKFPEPLGLHCAGHVRVRRGCHHLLDRISHWLPPRGLNVLCAFGWCRDVALYSLGVGACNADAEDEKELQLVYSRDGKSSIKVLTEGCLENFLKAFSTFIVAHATTDTFYLLLFLHLFSKAVAMDSAWMCLGLSKKLFYDPKLLLHGQHYIEMYGPIPSRAYVTNKIKIAGLHDRGKAAVLELETLTCLQGSDDVLCVNRSTIYLRGAGGFSDSSQPFSYATYAADEALLCGLLSGYFDPLHSDPTFAHAAGYASSYNLQLQLTSSFYFIF
ncbi:Enoyl-CoA hydratase 2, peroxisomal [Dichanthelium oligosanthes]|uniref:Enoyl-CoA hydratase 2, peroxisomal n=1 Tax=Dichanthelium oligosanthes TaxID=888268 RepID=A0A1E5UUZ0_9POAL|nr:Enoyl-CoA hydratase 2, peroxisomal [Dichanthelium oligosanthes]